MSILVTGATGAVGAHLAKRLLDNGHEVVSFLHDDRPFDTARLIGIRDRVTWVRGSILEATLVRRVIADYGPDAVFHLAALPIVQVGTRTTVPIWETNLLGTLNLLEAVRESGNAGKVIRFVFLSTDKSVTSDTPLLIRTPTGIERTNFGALWDKHAKGLLHGEVAANNLEVATTDVNGYVHFAPVGTVQKHLNNKTLFKIQYTGGSVTVTEDHSVFVFTEDGQIAARRTETLEEGDLLVTFDAWHKPASFNPTLKELAPVELSRGYNKLDKIRLNDTGVLTFLGTYLADGCCDDNKITLTVNRTTKQHLLNNAVALFTRHGYHFNIADRGGPLETVNLTVSATEVANLVNTLFGRGARNKRLCGSWPWNLNTEQVSLLLEGYKADSYRAKSGTLRFTTASKELAIDLTWLLRLHGISSNLSEITDEYIAERPKPIIDGREIDGKGFWFVTVAGLDSGQPMAASHRVPFNRCLPVSYARPLFADMPNQMPNLWTHRGVSKKRLARNIPGAEERLAQNRLGYAVIRAIEEVPHEDYVYDVSVPTTEAFFGGTGPILLHNTYGDAGSQPYSEDMPLNALAPYESSKAAADMAVRTYAHCNFAPAVVVARGCNIIAPGDLNFGRVFPRTIIPCLRDENPRLYKPSRQLREYMFVDDAVDALMTLDHQLKAKKEVHGQAYNVGSGHQRGLEEVVDSILQHFPGREPEWFEPPKISRIEIPFQRLDTSKIQELCSWTAKVSFEDTIARLVSWWRERFDRLPTAIRSYKVDGWHS